MQMHDACLIVACKFLYEEQLKQLDSPTLKYQRLRSDMIQVYK